MSASLAARAPRKGPLRSEQVFATLPQVIDRSATIVALRARIAALGGTGVAQRAPQRLEQDAASRAGADPWRPPVARKQ
jgi:hypothetical protein